LSTDVSEVRAASIIRALIFVAARTYETSVDNYFTRQYIPEDNYELHTRRCENLKSHKNLLVDKSILSDNRIAANNVQSVPGDTARGLSA
jgi:hypothetical protein